MDSITWYQSAMHRMKKEDFFEKNKSAQGRTWTVAIESFLTKWAESEGFVVDSDFDNPVRIDTLWKNNDQTEVAIEHENNGDNRQSPITREIEKLVNHTDAPLRVLITYLPESKLPMKFDDLHQEVARKLATKKRPDFEFLLMAGPYEIYSQYEYIAYAFRPEFVPTHLIPEH